MPHLTLPLSSDGCVLELILGVSKQREAALNAANQPIPSLISVRALVDTGASVTVIDEKALRRLALAPTGTTNILTPSTKGSAAVCMTYDAFVAIYHPTHSLVLGTYPILGSDFSGQGIEGLIGRDILQRCLLIYDGGAGNFILGF